MENDAMHVAELSDADLVAESLGGNRDAFGRIVERYQTLIASLAYCATGNVSQSEDLAQQTFFNAWKQLAELRERAKLRPWLCSIARSLIANEFRRQGREPDHAAESLEALDEWVSPEPLPPDHVISGEEKTILWRSLERIPVIYREPLVLFYREQQSIGAVALDLGLSEDAVKQRLSRGRKLLQEQFLAFVAGALKQTSPGKAFTIGVMAALPLLAATAKAATVGTALANHGSETASLLKYLTMSNVKIAIISSMVVAALVVPLLMQHQTLAQLRAENQALRQQVGQLAPLQDENQRLSNLVAQASAVPSPSEQQERELARLRDEAGRLRQQTNEMAKAEAEMSRGGRSGRGAAYGKRIFPNTTMPAFAKFLGGILRAPVADQTGLSGAYYVAMTPPNAGGPNGKLERVSAILLDELGLRLIPFAGPFDTNEENFPTSVRMHLPDGTWTNVPASSSATNEGFAIKVDHSDAPGLQSGLGEIHPPAQSAGRPTRSGVLLNALDSDGLPQGTATKLMLIDTAKRQWALDQRKQDTETPTWQDLQSYLAASAYRDMNDFTNAPEGSYIIGSLGQYPRFHSGPVTVQP